MHDRVNRQGRGIWGAKEGETAEEPRCKTFVPVGQGGLHIWAGRLERVRLPCVEIGPDPRWHCGEEIVDH
eukprot:3311996-Lingulodinium_polyedra.AAC.1